MKDTPIEQNGPFTLDSPVGDYGFMYHTIRGRDGVAIVEITGQLVDGSCRTKVYPDGVIRTRAARREEAQFVLAAMNAEHWRREKAYQSRVKPRTAVDWLKAWGVIK